MWGLKTQDDFVFVGLSHSVFLPKCNAEICLTVVFDINIFSILDLVLVSIGLAQLRMGDNFDVVWSSYSDHVTSMLKDIIASNEFTDVTLVCTDKVKLQAHKIVLSAGSHFFNNILNDAGEFKPIVYLKGIHSSEMKNLLEFIYTGETSFAQHLTDSFLSAANELEIKAFSNDSLSSEIESVRDTESQPNIDEKNKDTEDNKIQHQDLIACHKPQSYPEIENKVDMPILAIDTDEVVFGSIDDVDQLKGNMKVTKNKEDMGKEDKSVKLIDTDEVMFGSIDDVDLQLGSLSKTGSFINCLQCDKEFFDLSALELHISISHNDVKNMCELCGFKSSKSNEGGVHIMIHKISKHNYKLCSKCEFISANEEDISEHELEDHDITVTKSHKCLELQCSFSCNNKRVMKVHQRHHRRIFKATINEKALLKNHHEDIEVGERFEVDQKELSELYSCKECEYQNTKIDNIKRHIESRHLGRKISFMPVEVEERFTIKEKGKSILYLCKECEYQNPKKINIKRHIESKHLGIAFPCDQCGYLAQRMPILKEHIASVHEKLFRHKCKKCDKSFNSWNALQIHEKSIHQGITYPCTLCRSVFTRPCNLHKHKKKYH